MRWRVVQSQQTSETSRFFLLLGFPDDVGVVLGGVENMGTQERKRYDTFIVKKNTSKFYCPCFTVFAMPFLFKMFEPSHVEHGVEGAFMG